MMCRMCSVMAAAVVPTAMVGRRRTGLGDSPLAAFLLAELLT